MMEVKFLLICCLLGLSSADVRDAIGGVGVNVDYRGLNPPLSHGAGLQIHGAVTGSVTSDDDSGTASGGATHSQHSGREIGANNVFFHAKIGGSSITGGGATSTHDINRSQEQGIGTGNFGDSHHLTMKARNNGGAVRDERIQDLIGTLPCCGDNKNVASHSGGPVGTQVQSTLANTGRHSSSYATLIGSPNLSNTENISGKQPKVSGELHTTGTSGNIENMAGHSQGFHNLIGTLNPNDAGSNAGTNTAGFANLIGTVNPNTAVSNPGGHSTGFGNLIGTLTPANTGGVSQRYSSELSGHQSIQTSGNVGGMTEGHSAGFGNLIGTLTPSHAGNHAGGQSSGYTNLIGTLSPGNMGVTGGHSAGFGNLIGTLTPTNSGGVSHRYSSEFSGHQSVEPKGNIGGMTTDHSVGFGNLIGTIKPGDFSTNFGHTTGFSHSQNNAGARPGTARVFPEKHSPVALIQGGDFSGLKPNTQPALSTSYVPTNTVNHAGVTTLEYKVPESAQKQAFEHHISVPAVSTFSGNNRASISSHGQIGSSPAVSMVDIVKSVEVPSIHSQRVFSVPVSHKNIPSAGISHFHTSGIMPVRFSAPSPQVSYQTPSVQPAMLPNNYHGYNGYVSSAGVGSNTEYFTGQHRSYQAPASVGFSGGHYNAHESHSSSHASSHGGHGDEEFQGY